MSDLDELRQQIDSLDEELLKTLAQRMDVVEEIGRYKKSNNLELLDEKRLQALLSARLAQADSLNLPKELVTELYELIHKFALQREAKS